MGELEKYCSFTNVRPQKDARAEQTAGLDVGRKWWKCPLADIDWCWFCILFVVWCFVFPSNPPPNDLLSSPEHLRPGNVVAVGSSTAQQRRVCCKEPRESVTAIRANMHKRSAKMGKIVTQKHNWIQFTAGEEKRRCRRNSSAAWLVAARIVSNWTPVDPRSAKWGAQ